MDDMTLTRTEASDLMDLIEAATGGGQWRQTVHMLHVRGADIDGVRSAWLKLETMAHMAGTVPDRGEFDE